MGVVGGHLAAGTLHSEPLCDDELVVFASPDHPLARRKSTELDEVLEHGFAVREKGSATRERFERWLAERSRACRAGVELGSPEAVKRAVAEGAWLGALSRVAVAWEVEAGRLKELRVRGLDLRLQFRVVRHAEGEGGRAVEEWVRVLRESVAR